MFSSILSSWNPNAYPALREIPLKRVFAVSMVNLIGCVVLFWLLVLPAFLQADQSLQRLGETTNITFDASMQVSEPTYLVHNPNILFTQTEGDGVVVIRPQGITIKKFFVFGAETYGWKQFSSPAAFPPGVLEPLFFFLLPSLFVWSGILVFALSMLSVLVFSGIAHLVSASRGLTSTYATIWKVSLYATMPALLLLAALPILRIGLPIAVIFAISFVVWLGYSIVGTTLLSDKPAPKHRDKIR